MNWEAIATWIKGGINKPLFMIAETQVTLVSIASFLIIIAVSIVISWIVQRMIKRSLGKSFAKKAGTFAAINRLVHYLILFIGLGIALQTVGVKMNALFAAGALFAVAIGFAMQNIVQNFVSGIILLVERSIKPGDILEVDNTVVKVIDMGIRTTVVRTWKEEDIIMPNSILSQSQVKNFTLKNDEYRIGVLVGVTYSSDLDEVFRILEASARSMPWALKNPEPKVLLQDFGSSSVDFGVYVSINEPWKMRVRMSEMRKVIWDSFKKAGITIAFPQLDVHFDPPVESGFNRIGSAA